MDAMSEIREGMKVVALSGNEVGTVKNVKMGNPTATTADGQVGELKDGFLSSLASAFTGADTMDDERQERLLRMGFIEVDGTGLKSDFFVASDRIDRVANDTVYLNVEEPE